METKGKNIFDSLLHPMTDHDKQAALEAAQKMVADLENKVKDAEQKIAATAARADAAEKKVAELQAQLSNTVKAQSDLQTQLMTAQTDLRMARTATAQQEQRANAAEAKVKEFENAKMAVQQQAVVLEAAKAQVLATHKITSEETLSHLSLKYYGHATEPYWRIIYEANKDVIGANPNHVRPGTVLNIPVLPDSMKK